MGDAVVLKRGGSPGSGVIHVWKEYNVNTSVKYVWDKWSLADGEVLRSREVIGYNNKPYDASKKYIYHQESNTYDLDGYMGIDKTSITIYRGGSCSVSPLGYWILCDKDTGQLMTVISQNTGVASLKTFLRDEVSGSLERVIWNADMRYYDKIRGSTPYPPVESTSSTAYPNGGYSGSYWYENRREVPVYSMGTFKQNVYSTNPNMYPQNGRLGDYWYVYDGTIS